MLTVEQIDKLLRRCERHTGKTLIGIKGNLKNAKTRSEAIWELLVIDAAAAIGAVEYEPRENGSPDIRLTLKNGTTIWIEATFLNERFYSEKYRLRRIERWVWGEGKRRDIPPEKIELDFHGKPTEAGHKLNLPEDNRKRFLRNTSLRDFFDKICHKPTQPYECTLSPYTISLSYKPKKKGHYLVSSGSALDAPRTVAEHAVYRRLVDKAKKIKQYELSEPCVVCIGSQDNYIVQEMTSPHEVSVNQAIKKAFGEYSSLTAVILVSIDSTFSPFSLPSLTWRARAQPIPNNINPNVRYPLSDTEFSLLWSLDFNKWKFTFPSPKIESSKNAGLRHSSEELTMSCRNELRIVEIPENALIDVLAGRSKLTDFYAVDESVLSILKGDYAIISCDLKKGAIENGIPAKIILKLVPRALFIHD